MRASSLTPVAVYGFSASQPLSQSSIDAPPTSKSSRPIAAAFPISLTCAASRSGCCENTPTRVLRTWFSSLRVSRRVENLSVFFVVRVGCNWKCVYIYIKVWVWLTSERQMFGLLVLQMEGRKVWITNQNQKRVWWTSLKALFIN